VDNSEGVDKGIVTVEIVIAVLESGHSVELPATGYSMFPTLKPGDRVVVKPLPKIELPMIGSVVVFEVNGPTEEGAGHRAQGTEHNSVLVMHRLVDIKHDDSGNPLLITRGDTEMENDKPWVQQQLIGAAVSYKRCGKERLVKVFVPGVRRYKYNRRVLWVVNKISRVIGITALAL